MKMPKIFPGQSISTQRFLTAPSELWMDTFSSTLVLGLTRVACFAVAILGLATVGCGNGSSNPVPSISSASPASATAGGSAFTLTVNGSNFVSASTVHWNGSSRSTTFVSASQLTASISASDIASAGSAKITVVNPSPGGGASAPLAFTVNAPAPTVSISVNPTSLTLGSSATLTWSSTNATSCTAAGGWSGPQSTSGTQSVTPTAAGTVTYSLTCAWTGGCGSASATLIVNSPAPAVSISVNPTSLTLGSSATVTWSSTNATSCTAAGGWSGPQPTSGTQSVAPTAAGTVTYSLTCAGTGGSGSASATLTVNAPAPTVSISVNPTSLTLGSSATLTWSSTNATSCTAGGAWSGTLATTGSQSVTPAASGSIGYDLTCSGTGGSSDASAALSVAPASPLANFTSYDYGFPYDATTPGLTAALSATPSQLVWVGGFGELTGTEYSRNNIDPNHQKIVIGYVDVPEATAHWSPELFVNGTVPSWFGNPLGLYGIYSVQYWNPAWEPIIFKQIDNVINQGYDGVMLDVLYGDAEWSSGNSYNNPVYANATPAMATLVSDILAHIKSKNLTNFYVIGSNPTGLVLTSPSSLNGLDGILYDSLFYNGNSIGVYQGSAQTNWYAQSSPLYQKMGLPIFVIDYPPTGDVTADLQTLEYATNQGWMPTISPDASQGITPGSSFLATGPYMFMATFSNSAITGSTNAINFISGGWTSSATLTGGNMGDYFIGGPGTNAITAGSGDDTIYAHPQSSMYKNKIAIDVSSTVIGTATTPSVAVQLNGSTVVQATPIASAYPTNTQELLVDTLSVSSISSLQITVSNASYTDQNNYSNLELDSMTYNGRTILLSAGTYSAGGSSDGFSYSNNGTIGFSADSFAMVPAYPSDNADVINGGGGTNTVVYRGPSSNYTFAKQSNGSWLVTSASTAEGPDTLTNVQVLQFSDKQVTLP